MSEEKEKNSKKNKKEKSDVKQGILVVGGIILFTVLMFFLCAVVPTYVGTYFNTDTRDIEGKAEAYDPIAAFDTVSEYAGENAQLMSIEAYYVHSDGTLDLHADYYPRVEYDFYIAVSEDAGNDIPLGAPNSSANAEVLYQHVEISVWDPGQWRSVSTSTSYSYVHLGMERDIYEPVRDRPGEAIPAPQCSFADLWAIAIAEENAPAEAVAVITYDADGYEFYINDTDIRMQFDEDCTED